MRLYHATDEDGAQGICAHGFGVSHVGDCPEQSWFGDNGALAGQSASRRGWLVIVEVPEPLPDDIASRYPYMFEDGTPYAGNLLLPWGVVNRYAPFRCERDPNYPNG
jgi:hypothetical protein